MTAKQVAYIVSLLAGKGILFDKGLSDEEVYQIEARFSVKFLPDLKLLLQTALPISDRFVNWRLGLESEEEAKNIDERLNWPLHGMLFDVRMNNFWLPNWGSKPQT